MPTRIARRAPSAISSVSTIAADGPPMPVAWIVSGSPSGASPGVAPQAAVVVEHQRLLQQRLGQRERATGVAGQQHALGQRRRRAQVDRGSRRGRDIGGGDFRLRCMGMSFAVAPPEWPSPDDDAVSKSRAAS